MAHDLEAILLENLRECLAAYQRALLVAASMSATFLLFSLQIGRAAKSRVTLLNSEVSTQLAWLGVLAVFVVLGCYLVFLVNRLRTLASRLASLGLPMDAVLLSSSSATMVTASARILAVVGPSLLVLVGLIIEIIREGHGRTGEDRPWLGMIVLCALVVSPYLIAAYSMRTPLYATSSASTTRSNTAS